jgi:hypothetical protein
MLRRVYGNHGVLCWASGCVSLCAILSWVYGNQIVLCWTSGWESRCECCASVYDSWWGMLNEWLWIMASHAVPVVVNHIVLCLANGCELWRIMLCQWVLIMLCYSKPQQVVRNHDANAVPVGVNQGEFCWDSCCESRFTMLSQWLWIIVNYAELVVVKHCELYWASGCESYCAMLSRVHGNYGVLCCASGCVSLRVILSWVCVIMVSYAEPVGVNHYVICWVGCAGIMVCYADQVAGNYGVNAVPVGMIHGELC